MTVRPRLYLALAPTAVLALAGCGTQTLNTAKAEQEIQKGIAQQAKVRATVDCPDDVDVEQGNRFQCTARDQKGNTAPVDVTQKDDKGNIQWELNQRK